MTRDPQYDVLFEPVKIGPVTAKNRFYQVPHCTGMGYMRPRMLAEMRGIKAEGGWGVVCTEYNSIHPTSDDLPHPSASLWNDSDIRAHALMTEKVHEHGALAGAELWYGGARTANLLTREVPMDVTARCPTSRGIPTRPARWTRATFATCAAGTARRRCGRAMRASTSSISTPRTPTFCPTSSIPRINTRSDEYGGSLENRTRLVRELIEETKEAVGDRCAVAVRFSADEEIGTDGVPIHGERRDMLALLADLPDLWDINIANYFVEMGVSRFTKEAALEPYMEFRQAGHQQAGGHRGPLHLARHDGQPDQAWGHRFHRRRAPFDRRPVPAGQDRSGRFWARSANASAATFAMRAIPPVCRSGAPRIPRWARNGARAGTPKRSRRGGPTRRCSWLAPVPLGWRRHGRLARGATR